MKGLHTGGSLSAEAPTPSARRESDSIQPEPNVCYLEAQNTALSSLHTKSLYRCNSNVHVVGGFAGTLEAFVGTHAPLSCRKLGVFVSIGKEKRTRSSRRRLFLLTLCDKHRSRNRTQPRQKVRHLSTHVPSRAHLASLETTRTACEASPAP